MADGQQEEGGADILTGILFGNVNEDGVAELDYLDEVGSDVIVLYCIPRDKALSHSDPVVGRQVYALVRKLTQGERQHLSRIGAVLKEDDRRDLVQVSRLRHTSHTSHSSAKRMYCRWGLQLCACQEPSRRRQLSQLKLTAG